MHKYIEVSNDEKMVGKNGTYQIELDRKNLLESKGLNYNFYKYFNEYSFFQHQEDAFNFEATIVFAKKIQKSKITDFMGYGPWIMAFPWLISERMYNVMTQFNLGKHKLFEVKIDNYEEKYFFLHKTYILREQNKYEHSIVSVGQKDLNNYQEYNFSNIEDYLEFKKRNVLCEFKTLAVAKEYEKEDVVYTQSGGFYFSEQLIKAIEENSLTGLQVNNNRCKIKFV